MYPTKIEETINYIFKDRELLNQAITHSSWFNEKKEARQSQNEKLEYLGDAILNSIISILLYKKYKDRQEGFLSNARSCLVKRETLTEIAKDINLGKHMYYGNGENNIPLDSKVLSNMLEALIGAIYLDGGLKKVTRVVKNLFLQYFNEERLNEKNPKNVLQEYSQKRWGMLPKYKFTRKTKGGFTVLVYIGKEFKAKGAGKNKKEAEQQAAKELLNTLIEEEQESR
ncbi:MAG: ribonuclease III [Proteobacteria bacterium]|jgi:ribonuclease-3|nr:ribonuclease III [Pseudomonadota bacterium]